MSRDELTSGELSKLPGLFNALLITCPLRLPLPNESEPKYTGSVLLPAVQAWLPSLKRPFLFLRADGGVAPYPVSTGGISFYPDLEIAAHGNRYLALEVKFIRDADASGSVTKALGQALLYRTCGIKSAQVLLLDLRTTGAPLVGSDQPAFESLRESGIRFATRKPNL